MLFDINLKLDIDAWKFHSGTVRLTHVELIKIKATAAEENFDID